MEYDSFVELGINVKKMDFCSSMSSNYAYGLCSGFVESYGNELKSYGLDDMVIRKLTLIALRENGFRESTVNKVIALEPGEWEMISQNFLVDEKQRIKLDTEIRTFVLDGLERFEKKHPDYFQTPQGIMFIAK